MEKLIAEYQTRIKNYNILIGTAEDEKRNRRKVGDTEGAQIASAETRRLSDLRQLCVQIVKDLESL